MERQTYAGSVMAEHANRIIENKNMQTTTDVGSELENLGIRKIYEPTIHQVREAFVQVDCETIDAYYNRYMSGANRAHVQIPLPIIEVVKTADIRVFHSNAVACNCGHDWAIERLSSEYSFNYMGYDLTKGCLAFKGQIRLFDNFLEATRTVFERGLVDMAYVRPRGLHIPIDGLNRGLNYEEFASQVEIVDCLLFLKDPSAAESHTANRRGPSGTQTYATPSPTTFQSNSSPLMPGQGDYGYQHQGYNVATSTPFPAVPVAAPAAQNGVHPNYAVEQNWTYCGYMYPYPAAPRGAYPNVPVQSPNANNMEEYYGGHDDGRNEGPHTNPA